MHATSSPAAALRLPAEWEPHDACWTAFPWDIDLWGEHLGAAQTEFADFMAALAPHEPVRLLVPNAAIEAEALALLGTRHPDLRCVTLPFGDIWLRDTGPIFVLQGGTPACACFDFNGWGHKYALPGDDSVARRISEHLQAPAQFHHCVLEGGSIEPDGEGTLLTTRQCLLNPNRNPKHDARSLEAELQRALGIDRVLWLKEGLVNDHTDGHIDTLARFIAPGSVVCMAPTEADDPNAAVLQQIAADLAQMRDARGRTLKVHTIPSPGRILDDEGRIMPASYVNFYIGNGVVVMPTYGSPQDAAAVAELAQLFPEHRVVGRRARAILGGGGAFHCITQQQPRKL